MKYGKWIWLGLWILSLVGISNYGGTVSYGFFFAITLIPLLSLFYLFLVFLQFKIYQEVESRDMICGQPMPYYFILRNESFFGFAGIKVRMFPNFSKVENVEEDTEYELLPGDEFRYETRLTCKYRGEYQVGVKEVVVTDFFGLFSLRYRIPSAIRAIVHPRLVEVTEVAGISQFFTKLQQETSIEKVEPDVTVRDYIRGDSPSRIHWKTTAREQKLKIRNDIDEDKQEVTLFFDTKRYGKRMEEYLPLESKMLEALLALAMFFAKKNVHTSVYYGEDELRRNMLANIRSFEEFYTRVSNITFQPKVNTAGLFEECFSKGLLNAPIIVGIFHELSSDIMQLTEQLATAGTSVIIYVVTDEDMEMYTRENTPRKKVIVIPTHANLEGLL